MVCRVRSRIRENFSMTSRRACGPITTSWHRMWSKRFAASLALTIALLAPAATSLAQSESALADRIEAADRKAALQMIGNGAAVNAAQPDGSTPLHWAVYRVDEELVNALLARGAKADVINAYGSSPLAEAVRVANSTIVGLLLD